MIRGGFSAREDSMTIKDQSKFLRYPRFALNGFAVRIFTPIRTTNDGYHQSLMGGVP